MRKKSSRKTLLITTLTILTTIFCFRKSFEMSLSGDDWLTLYRYITTYTNFSSHFNLSNFRTNYDVANMLMGVIYKLFLFNPKPYYFFSLVLRILAALSFYPSVLAFTKNWLMSILSSTFFSFIYAGIETTSWVFNMNTYLSIIFLNIFIFLHFRLDYKVSYKHLIAGFILLLSFLIAPTRMHGIAFFVPLMVIVSMNYINKKEVINSIFKIFIYLSPVSLFRYFFQSSQDIANVLASFKLYFHKEAIINLFSNLGHIILPDILVPNFAKIYFALIGLAYIIFYFSLIFFNSKAKRIQKTGTIMISGSILFLTIPWLIHPHSWWSSEHRYQIVPAGFLCISYAIVVSILFETKKWFVKFSTLIFLILILFSNLYSQTTYFSKLLIRGRSQEDVERYFGIIKSNSKFFPNELSVFLFTTNDPERLYNAIEFGFTPHMILTSDVDIYDLQNAPFSAESFESLVSLFTDKQGKEFIRYGYEPREISIENVFSFHLQGKELITTTSKTRDELKKVIYSK